MIGRMFNNFGICASALGFCLNEAKELGVANALLVMPLINNQELLTYLSNENTRFESLEQLLVRKPNSFLNFNARFYDGLPVTLNALQFLSEMDYLDIKKGKLIGLKEVPYSKDMGNRAGKIFKSRHNLVKIIKSDATSTYRNLRVEL